MKQPAAIWEARFEVGNEVATASAIMQHDMPAPLNMNTARRPNRSMATKARNEERNFHVRAPAERIREISLLKPRFSWKRIGA